MANGAAEAGERSSHRLGADSPDLPRIWRTVNRRKPGTDPVAVLQVPQLARLPFGQLLVVLPDRLAKRPRAPVSCAILASTILSRWAPYVSLLERMVFARRRQALGLLPPIRVGRHPGQLEFLIIRNVLERGACIHVPFRFAWKAQDMFAGREVALVILKDLDQGCARDLAGISGFSINPRMRGMMSM